MKHLIHCRSVGFTLIELVVVLSVLAVMTHLAVVEATRIRQSKLRKAADRQLQALSSAVYTPRSGEEEASGFLVDMGRLPRALPVDPAIQGSPLSLRELWERPADVKPYAVRRATADNLAMGTDASIVDVNVLVPCGWRGPYLHLPFHRGRLLDPWGNAIESPDDARFSRLTDLSTNELVRGEPVELVRHFGSDGRPDTIEEPVLTETSDGVVHLVPDGGMDSRLLVMTTFIGRDGVESAKDGMVLTLRWYAPCGDAITGGVVRAVAPAPLVVDSLTPGVRFIRVCTPGNTGAVKRVSLRPGDNLHFEKLFAR